MASKDRDERTKSNGSVPVPGVEAEPRFLYRTEVPILVGPHAKQFDVHKELLCSVSDFFSAALNGGFKETETGTVKLPEQDAETFQYFVHWLYASKLTGYFRAGTSPSIDELNAAPITMRKVYESRRSLEDWDAKDDLSDAQHLDLFEEAPIPELVSLHILADALQVRGLRDHIVNVIVKVYATDVYRANAFWYCPVSDSRPQPILIMNDAYERLPSTSTLRRFLVELCVLSIPPDALNSKRGLLSFDSIFDWLVRLQRLGVYGLEPDDFGKPSIICEYHEHDVECPLKTRDIVKSEIREW